MWATLKQKIWEWRRALIIAPSVAALVIVLRMTGLLQLLELSAMDQKFRLRPLEPPDSRIVIVGINESDLQKWKTWPLPDYLLAEMLNKIKQQQPRAIGLDIYRDLPVEPGYAQLVQVFKSTPNLIGIFKLVGDQPSKTGVAPPQVLTELGQISANDLPWDVDGKIRRCFLYLESEDKEIIYSLGFKLAWIYLEAQGIKPELTPENFVKLGQVVFPPFNENDGGYVRTDAAGYQLLLNYRGFEKEPEKEPEKKPEKLFKTVSLTDVLENRIEPNLMRDRIVIIGSTAKSLKDFLLTPYSSSLGKAIPEPMAGVEVHANIASQIISAVLDGRSLLKTWPDPLEWLWILVWSTVGATLTCKWRLVDGLAKISFPQTIASIPVASACLVISSYSAFLMSLWIPVVPPLIALVTSTIVTIAYTLWENLILSHKKLEEYARTLEIKVQDRTVELKNKNEQLEQTLEQLKAAQKQMIAQEKLASLGALTAGVAHEIRNPLNFVNNFARVSVDLTEELKEELENQAEYIKPESLEYINEIFTDLHGSVADIKQHGLRIEGIIQSMLMHAQNEKSNASTTDLNSLLAEAVQLSYNSLRAKEKNLNVTLKTDYDKSIGEVYIMAQDVSRAFVNIMNNACYAAHAKKQKIQQAEFEPIIFVKTRDLGDRAEIRIRDNGEGIPDEILEKIFNPFFTTKPPGEGTGLGLSLTYETIVGQHQGEITVDTKPGEYTEFIIVLPKNAIKI